MERKENQVMTSITALRDELLARQDRALPDIEIQQAFDRLVLGVQDGTFSATDVERAVSEIRERLSQPTRPAALMPRGRSARAEAASRNARALADRLLASDRGTWDMRHVEIVQGAIAQIARSGASDAAQVASRLQDRMSQGVWAGNVELVENASQFESESRSLEKDLLELATQHDFAPRDLEVHAADRELAREPEKEEVHRAVQGASLQAIRAQMRSEADAVRVSKEYVETLSRRVAEGRQNAEMQDVQANVRRAGQQLLDMESAKLGRVLTAALRQNASNITNEQAANLEAIAQHVVSARDTVTADDIRRGVEEIRNAVREVPQMQGVLADVARIEWRANALAEIVAESPAAESAQQDEKQLLEARMLFEQKRMQFEQNPTYRQADADLLKAVDFEVPEVSFESPATNRAMQNIRRVHQIAQSAASGDIGLYAPVAGSEHTPNAAKALQIADEAAPQPVAAPNPTMQSDTTRRMNRLIRDVRQLAFMPSVRADMGFAAPKSKINATWADGKPLFKRVHYADDSQETRNMISAMYKVSGVQLKADTKPLRKSIFGSKLFGANLEMVKMLAKKFGGEKVEEAIDTAESYTKKAKDALDAVKEKGVFGAIGDFVGNKVKAKAEQLKEKVQEDADEAVDELRASVMAIPSSVIKRLKPFFRHFDLSSIKLIVSDKLDKLGAMGATIGKTIFIDKNTNFESAEGLGLLAHEITHTMHFEKGNSVESKEQEAENMETRVRNAYDGSNDYRLALERDPAVKPATVKSEPAAPAEPEKPTVGFDTIYAEVTEMVIERIKESIQLERDRRGH